MTLWRSHEAAKATGGRATGDWSAQGVTLDSRAAQAGDLFVALKDQRDGHDFVAGALAAGAAAAMVSRIPEGVAPGAPLLLVDDVMAGLQALGRAGHARAVGLRAVGVTGSAGKTSTKEMLRAMLSPQGVTHAAEKSYNNHWGVPLTLAQTPADARYGVYEIGMNHPGEITPLAAMVRPEVALVTTIAPAHLGHFASLAEIAEAKAEIFTGLAPGGAAAINAAAPHSDLLIARAKAAGAEVFTFGDHPAADARLDRAVLSGDATLVDATLLGRKIVYRIGAAGRRHAENSLGALLGCLLLGADPARAALALYGWRPGAGRGARLRIGFGTPDTDGYFLLIDESYNANPSSMRAALEVLGAAPVGVGRRGQPGRRIAFVGDMLELGAQAQDLHAEIGGGAEMQGVDMLCACGPLSRALYDAAPADKRGLYADDSTALAEAARKFVRPGDAVMVKGSLGSRMARVVAALRGLGVEMEDETAG